MANNARIAIMRAKIEGVVTDLMLKTTANYVYVDDTTTLATKMVEFANELAAKATATQLQEAINGLGALAKKDKVAYADLETALAALINGKAEAQALTDEIARAKAAEEANTAAIGTAKTELSTAISAEKSRAEGVEAGLRTDIDAVKADYLKAADKTELSNAINAEKERAEAAELSLQNQIKTIMDNPDAEGAINSINEFTQFVKDHGEVAEGFRQGIADNAAAIALAETKADATAKYEELAGWIYEVGSRPCQVDWNQNNPEANGYIHNRPFGDGETILSWDNVAEGKETVFGWLVKISDATPAKEDIIGKYFCDENYENKSNWLVREDDIYSLPEVDESYGYRWMYNGNQLIWVVTKAHDDFTPGVYVSSRAYDTDYLKFNVAVPYLKQIDEKFIPDSIARAEDLGTAFNYIERIGNDLYDVIGTVNGLGDLATKDVITENEVDASLMEKINASAQGNHSHANKDLLDTYTQTEANLADAVAKKHEHTNMAALSDITAAKIASWSGKAKVYGASEEVNLADGEIYIQLLV